VVHVEPDEVGAALGARALGLTGVYAHAHADLHAVRPGVTRELELGPGGRHDRGRRRLEDREEGVALGVHCLAARTRDRTAHDPRVVAEHVLPPLDPELRHELRRALDVGEEEGQRRCGHA
jgi:hypothetical protein